TCIRITERVSEEGSINYGSVQSILTDDLDARYAFVKFGAKLLSADQKEDRLSAALDLLKYDGNEKMFVTRDESQVSAYESRRSRIQREFRTPSPRWLK
ncbi:hypothetical protein AVEN_173641-1, partial [Araneus ventricosus]